MQLREKSDNHVDGQSLGQSSRRERKHVNTDDVCDWKLTIAQSNIPDALKRYIRQRVRTFGAY